MSDQLRLAGFIQRICAYFVDLFIVSSFMDFVLMLIPVSPNMVSLLFLLMQSCYHLFSEGSRWQASLGQRAMGIYIVRIDAKSISRLFALDRYFSQVLCMVLMMMAKIVLVDMLNMSAIWMFLLIVLNFVMLCWYSCAFFSSNRQTVHDRLFGTMVVHGRL